MSEGERRYVTADDLAEMRKALDALRAIVERLEQTVAASVVKGPGNKPS